MGSPGGGEAVETMCKTALGLGYRHLDTADGYQNEEHVGKAIKDSGIPRSEIFVTTKLNNGDHGRVKEAFETSLKKLNCEYIDLFLIHWPQATSNGKSLQPDQSPTYVETWKAMEELLDTGKVRSIGVSNFSIKTLEVLLPQAKVVPAVNQVQLHPCLPDNPLLEYCTKKGIHVTAWSPLGRGGSSPFFTDATVKKVAEKNQLTTAQVILSWGYQRGTSIIPKSEKESRMKENMQLVHLDEEDFKAIDNLHKQPGMHRDVVGLPGFADTGLVFGWTPEQLGWNWDRNGRWIE